MHTRVYLLLLLTCSLDVFAGNVILATIGAKTEFEAGADLSPAGQAYAEALGELLSATEIDSIYVTPYPGTRQTAAAISQSTGITVKEFSRSQLANLSGTLVKSQGTVVVVAWEADLRVLWRQLDLRANLTTPMNGRVLLLRPDVPGLHALTIRVPTPPVNN